MDLDFGRQSLIRGLCASVAAIALVTGCVSVTGPSLAPSGPPSVATPSPVVTTSRPVVTSSPAPSVAVSEQPNFSPQAPATATPAPSASPVGPSVPGVSPPAPPAIADGDLLFLDDMDDPSSGWSVGEIGNASASFTDEGGLQLQIGDAGQAIWSPRRLAGEFGVLLVAGGYV